MHVASAATPPPDAIPSMTNDSFFRTMRGPNPTITPREQETAFAFFDDASWFIHVPIAFPSDRFVLLLSSIIVYFLAFCFKNNLGSDVPFALES